MKAYIIYHHNEAVKNASFIEMFKKAGEKHNIVFEYTEYSDYQNKPLPDFVLNRTRNYNVSKWYEERGVTVLHTSLITKLGNDKYEALKYLQNTLPSEILSMEWCPKSYLYRYDELIKFSDKMIMGKYIIKSLNGHGGTEVYMVSDVASQKIALNALEGKDCLVQEIIKSNSDDLRVYILGGNIYAAMLRHGNNDFRSNFSLGGYVSEYHLSAEQKKYILHFIKAFGGKSLGMVGIDFIVTTDNRLVFNELEEMVGSRMLYKCTDKDIVSDYVLMLSTRL